ncbi:MAG: quinol monooxygenase YgiN [Gammaproteobacteria bacterium]|jgi:quinol monooxygenase YgiN
MYLTAGHFKFKADSIKRAAELMNEIVVIGRQETGIHQYAFYLNPEVEQGYFLFEEWNSKESHDKHFESDEMQALIPEFFELLAEPASISYFDATLSSKV